ncbi:MAG: hypothetical protein V4671_14595 [Armatimonadota bacterium]
MPPVHTPVPEPLVPKILPDNTLQIVLEGAWMVFKTLLILLFTTPTGWLLLALMTVTVILERSQRRWARS